MSDYKNSLEQYLAEKLKEIDPYARPTRGSGCGNEIGDISNQYFFVEAKQKLTKENIIMDYKKEWKKLNRDMPINTSKLPFIAIENKHNEKFIVLSSEDFFDLIYKIYKEKE